MVRDRVRRFEIGYRSYFRIWIRTVSIRTAVIRIVWVRTGVIRIVSVRIVSVRTGVIPTVSIPTVWVRIGVIRTVSIPTAVILSVLVPIDAVPFYEVRRSVDRRLRIPRFQPSADFADCGDRFAKDVRRSRNLRW